MIKKILFFIFFLIISQQSIAKTTFYTTKQIINIEIDLCDQLLLNRVYHCLMNIKGI